jgi:hypothetical protein
MKNQTVRQARRKVCAMMRFFCRATLVLVLALVCAVAVNGAYGASPRNGGYNVYYGMLHSHTSISDGSGTPSEAYEYARFTAELDFFGIADHDYGPVSV